MKRLFKIIPLIIMAILPFSCSKNNDMTEIVKEQAKDIQNWKKGDNIPPFILHNEYMDTYYSELYEDGGLVNAALINQIKNKDLLLKIIASCDQRIDRKSKMQTLKNINFGENRLFDLFYNYSTREIATLHYRILYGSEDLANQIKQINPDCKNLDSFNNAMINGIKFSGNEHGAIGFVIELKRLKMNNNVTVDEKKIEQIASHVLRNREVKPTFKELDAVASEIVKTTTNLNPNDTFQITYTGPYIPYKKEKEGLNISHGDNSVFFSLQLGKLY
jgi:hypothetical protein